MLNILLVEDDVYVQEYLKSRIMAEDDMQLAACIQDAFEAEEYCEKNVDVVLMDAMTKNRHSGISAGKKIKSLYPHIKIVVITSLVDPDILKMAKDGGADSLWYKDYGSEKLFDVIRKTVEGESIYPLAPPSVEIKKATSYDFTPKQFKILRLVILGYTYMEIAEVLGMTASGVRWHVSEMVDMCGLENKEELINIAVHNKWIVTPIFNESEKNSCLHIL